MTPKLQCRTIQRDEKFDRLTGKEFHLQKVRKERRIKIKKDKRLKKKRKEVDLKFMFPTGSARSFWRSHIEKRDFAPWRTRAARFRKRLPLISLSLSLPLSLSRLFVHSTRHSTWRAARAKVKNEEKSKRERERERVSEAALLLSTLARGGFVSDENRVRNAWKSS